MNQTDQSTFNQGGFWGNYLQSMSIKPVMYLYKQKTSKITVTAVVLRKENNN